MQRIAGLRHVQAEQRAPGAADRVEGTVAAGFQERHEGQRVLDHPLRPLQGIPRYVLQGQAAERQRDAALDFRAAHADQFERTAAKVAGDAFGLEDARYDAERRKFGLAPAGQDVDPDPADPLGLRG